MTQYKLIAIDLDDTLLDTKLRISPRVKELIQQLRYRGVVVTLATGRMYLSSRPIALGLGLDIPLITYQGALVKNCISGEELIHHPLPIADAIEVINLAREKGIHLNLYLNDQLHVERLSPEVEAYARLARVPVCLVPDLIALIEKAQQGPTKLVLIGEEEFLDDLEVELKPRFADRAHLTKSKPYYLEVTHPLATKGTALAELARYYGIKQAEVMAIGDSFNDLEMIEYAGLGVAMGNAQQEVKDQADYVTLGNDEDGVAEALEKFCF